MRASAAFFILLLCVGVRAEYKWTGTEWQWVESDRVEEGSGDGASPADDEDYDDYYTSDYDYGDLIPSKNNDVSSNNNNNINVPQLGITDDEDFAEGSGLDGSVIDPSPVFPFDSGPEDEGSGAFYPDLGYPPEKTSPPIDLDTPAGGVGAGTDDDDTSFVGGLDPVNPYFTDSTDNLDMDVFDDTPPRAFDEDIRIDDIRPGGGAPVVPVSTPATPPPAPATSTVKPTFVEPERNRPGHSDDVPTVSDVPTNRPVSFFAQPGILAAVIGGAVVGLLCAILLVMFIVYRMRKKDEGSYILEEPTRYTDAYVKGSGEYYA